MEDALEWIMNNAHQSEFEPNPSSTFLKPINIILVQL